MLVGQPHDTVGFEVRSLQELMAGRSFFPDGDDAVLSHLRRTATSAHWRNTWLFAASRLFADRQGQRPAVMLLLGELDSTGPIATKLLPGARLAVELLDEDITANQPLYRRLLLEQALKLLSTSYPGPTMTSLARVTHDTPSQLPELLHRVMPLVEEKLDGRLRDQLAALDFLAAWAELPGSAAVGARSRIEKFLRGTPPPALEAAIDALRQAPTRTRWTARGTPGAAFGAPDTAARFTAATRKLVGEADPNVQRDLGKLLRGSGPTASPLDAGRAAGSR